MDHHLLVFVRLPPYPSTGAYTMMELRTFVLWSKPLDTTRPGAPGAPVKLALCHIAVWHV